MTARLTRSASSETRLSPCRTTYQPFGEKRTDSAGIIATETKGFVGERYDSSPELQFLNARYYDPDLSLFTSPDWLPITDPGVGTNRFAYAGNSPVNASDPGGNCPSCVGAVVGGLVGLGARFTSDLINGDWSSPRDYAASAASGAIIGATGGLASPTLGGAIATGALSGVLGAQVESIVGKGEPASASDQMIGAAGGAAGGAILRYVELPTPRPSAPVDPMALGRQFEDDVVAVVAAQAEATGAS